mmetsp:Transcript_6196/g.12868  ORF Transcript_6196/g.12868 Transcript_6196/m.12868 type:complete len:334 (-) Transcript_6196:23-1024(-)
MSETVKHYYNEYHGHLVSDLTAVHSALRSSGSSSSSGDRPLIFTAGDSSLDNKYWFHDHAKALGGYEKVLRPPTMRQDVAYHLTSLSLRDKADGPVAINCAVEATTLNQRMYGLLPQDKFIRDNLRPSDVLVVSVGGNDIALAPAPCTIANMLGLICCVPKPCIENGCGVPLPCDDCCCGCGAGCLSTLLSCPPCGGYFLHLFGTRVRKYVESLVSKTKPKLVLVCMIYYLDQKPGASWADGTLSALGYNRDPSKLQLLIRKTFEHATSKIKIPGVEVVPVPLFEVLDGTRTEDYVARVEPSAVGGRKMAEFILDKIEQGGVGAAYGATMKRN